MSIHPFLLLLFHSVMGDSIGADPCGFPHFSESRCSIPDSKFSLFCDPHSRMSMAEMRIIHSNSHKWEPKCECPIDSGECHFRFGFVFIDRIFPSNISLSGFNAEYCPQVDSDLPVAAFELSKDETQTFVENYVRIIRERWSFGRCGEEVLILVIHEPPVQLSSQSPPFVKPMIFVSVGDLVLEHLGGIASLHNLIEEGNQRLRNSYPIAVVSNNLVERISDLLSAPKLDTNRPPIIRHHIPLWAWIIFGVCGVCFLLMGIGLGLIHSSSRRGTFRSKAHNSDTARRWKAGFVGEETQPITYVNLVQMMMPHPKGPTAPTIQQV